MSTKNDLGRGSISLKSTRFSGIRRFLHKIIVFVVAIGGCLVLIALLVGLGLLIKLRQSLPQLDGEIKLNGLSARVLVERDDLGVPVIHGVNRTDIARITGFLHAQDRFFQMDMLRRKAAGELAELLGEGAISNDRAARLHRFRMQARDILASSPPRDQKLLEAYAAGVNEGLAALASQPFEYLVLGADPTPWQSEDSLLIIFAMYLDLQGEDWLRESSYGVMHDVLPKKLFEFLTPHGTDWDSPMDGQTFGVTQVPGPEVFDLRTRSQEPVRGTLKKQWFRKAVGSNSWAVAGTHTRHGGALLANDMHLGLSVPPIWYRLSINYPDAHRHPRTITGITIPGLPMILVGSNGEVAWGLTNSGGDWSDLVVLTPSSIAGFDYLAPDGSHYFKRYREVINVKNSKPQILEVVTTIWGPIIDTDHRRNRRVLRWVAHDRQAINLGFLQLETVGSIEEAFTVANQTGAPAQNFVVVDAKGHIGWTILGPIPRRFGHDGRLPHPWSDGRRGWKGWLTTDEYPRISDTHLGRIWTANNRVVSGKMLAKIGDGSLILGARARQIRDSLLAKDRVSETDLLEIQLDDRALFLQRWRDLLLQVLTPDTLLDPRRHSLRKYVENWGGRAAIGSVGYRMVRNFRMAVAQQIFETLTIICKRADERFNYSLVAQQEAPLWRLVSGRPQNLLDPRYKNWEEQLLAVVDTTLDEALRDTSKFGEHTWGKQNTSQIRHFLSPFIPWASFWLDMSPTPLPGDFDMPRLQTPDFGASQRMIVSPGREPYGIFHMPAGQSGHPMSPYYRSGHNAWMKGEPTPFLAGPVKHRLSFVPAGP